MGFWDVVSSVATSAANSIQESANEIRELKEEMSKKSDRELANIAINKDGKAKTAAYSELKNRGYTDISEIKRIL